MCWGFPGDGWYDLIDKLSQVLEPLGVVAVQVKQKFGGLRFYTNGASELDSDAVRTAIRMAEEQAIHTCELCGEPGELRGDGWLIVRCDKCYEEGKNDNKS